MAQEQDADIRTEFKAYVVFNGKKLEPTVSELLEEVRESPIWDKLFDVRNQEKPPGWIWFHIPAASQAWLIALVHNLQEEGIIKTRGKGKKRGEGPEILGEGHGDGIESFVLKTFAGHKAIDFPMLGPAQDSKDATFSVAMRFLDSEDSTSYNESGNKMAQLHSEHVPEFEGLIKSRALDESFYVTSNEATLLNRDQVVYRYYKRYLTTVLANEDTRARYMRSGKKIRPRIVMVSPLRLWKISHDVVITAFPTNWEGRRDFEFAPIGHAYNSVMRSRPESATELVSKILASLVTFVDGPYFAGLNESLLTIFETETSAQTTEQLKIYQEFQKLVTARIQTNAPAHNAPADPGTADAGGADQPSTAIEIVNNEMECFRVVMDIRDELAMISSIFSEQERVIQSVVRTIKPLAPKTPGASATMNQLQEAELGILLWKQRIFNIDQRAQMVEKALGHLLGVKLEVSNLAEAEDSKKLLRSSKAIQESSRGLQQSSNGLQRSSNGLLQSINQLQESSRGLQESSNGLQQSSNNLLASNRELLQNINHLQESSNRLQESSKRLQGKTDKQSRYLFAFTVVTVFFTPLSFVSSFLAIPSRDYPQDGGVSWSQGQIGGGLAISLLLTIFMVVLTLMLNE